MRVSVLVIVLALTRSVGAQELANDSWVFGGNAAFPGGFVSGEQAASRFVPPSGGPYRLTGVRFLFGGASNAETVTLHVYADTAGSDAPGTEIFSGSYQLTPSSTDLQMIDLSAANVNITGTFRVGLQLNGGLPSIGRDSDGTIAGDKNFVFATNVGWARSTALGVTSDWILRAIVTSTGPTPDGGVPPDGGDTPHAATSAVWQEKTPPPGPRSGHAIAYDSARQRTVLFGGSGLGDTWEWDGTTWTQRATTGPSGRSGHSMAYDSARQRIVLFGGGTDFGDIGDTWEWDGTTWTQRATTGPSPRHGHAMAYDSVRQKTVLFGGISGSNVFGDVWEWDGTTWTLPIQLSTPSARSGAAMVYDSVRQKTVLFGGDCPQGGYQHTFCSDTWEWDGTNFTQRATTGPAARFASGMAYDSARQRTVLYGGYSFDPFTLPYTDTFYGDTWEWDGTSWTQRASTGPSAREGSAAAYDSGRQKTVLFGGKSPGDTWEWDGTSWTQRTSGEPSPRFEHAMAYDTIRGKAVLFGGQAGGGMLGTDFSGDTWEWDGTTWTQRATTGPSPRIRSAMAYDSARQKVVLFGGMVPCSCGSRSGIYFGDTWEWDGSTWTQVSSNGPLARYWHAMAYDSTRQRTVLFGGVGVYQNAEGFVFGDTWEWDGSSWTQLAMTRPSARTRTSMAYDSARGVTVLFGGEDTNGAQADTWEWDGTAWNQRSPTTSPSARSWHTMAYDSARHSTVVFGGDAASGALFGDTWEWDGTSWTHRALEGPGPREQLGMVYDSERGGVVLFGGYAMIRSTAYGFAGDTWEYHTRGGACTDGTQCDSGNCVDGVCCESSSCGTCQACNLADPGTCTPLTSGQDPDSCTGQNTCSNGQCVACAPGQCGSTPDGGMSTGGSGGNTGGSGGNTGGSGGNPGSGGGGGCSCAMAGDGPNAPLLLLVVMLGIRGRRALRRQRHM